MTQHIRKPRQLKPQAQRPAHEPAPATKPVVSAIHAFFEGRATEYQQKLFREWLINDACMTYAPVFRPGADGQRDTDFALGRAFVGQQIIGLLKINLLALEEN